MPNYGTADIRNIALVGHGGAGKTSLAEAILHTTGATSRLGSVPDKTSHLDYTDEEKERACSIDSSLCHVSHGGKEINIIDTPGAPDFVGQAIASLAAVETAVCVIPASAGIEVNTRRMMEKSAEFGLGRMIVINKIDAENINLAELLEQITETFGNACQPLNLPTGGGKGVINCFESEDGESDVGSVADAHTAVVEGIVGVDDALMEKYFGGELAEGELAAAAARAVASGDLVPILFTDSRNEIGITELLDALLLCAPNPEQGLRRSLTTDEGDQVIEPKADGPLIGQVFKISGDPKSHIKYSVLRVHSGTLTHDTSLLSGDDRKGLRPGQLHKFQGGEHKEVEAGIAGDIIALAKLDLHIGSVVHTGTPGTIAMPKYPTPMFALAVEPKSRNDADKVSGALHRFTEEDPCFRAEHDPATRELVIRGVGDLHLRSILSRM
jgi:elongation factor G